MRDPRGSGSKGSSQTRRPERRTRSDADRSGPGQGNRCDARRRRRPVARTRPSWRITARTAGSPRGPHRLCAVVEEGCLGRTVAPRPSIPPYPTGAAPPRRPPGDGAHQIRRLRDTAKPLRHHFVVLSESFGAVASRAPPDDSLVALVEAVKAAHFAATSRLGEDAAGRIFEFSSASCRGWLLTNTSSLLASEASW